MSGAGAEAGTATSDPGQGLWA